MRLEGKDQFYISGHVHKDGKLLTDITGDDIVKVNFDGLKLEGRVSPPGERFIHSEIYKLHPEVKSIVHAHPMLSIIFSVAGQEILPVEHRAVIFYPSVKILDIPAQINTPELGNKVAKALGDNLAILLRGHGNVVVGSSLEGACSNAFVLERNALIQYKAMTPGERTAYYTPRGSKRRF